MFDFFTNFSDEPAYRINYIYNFSWFGVSVAFILGAIFLIAALILYLCRKKIAGNFGRHLFILVSIFWLPLAVIFYLDNFRDFLQNILVYGQHDFVGKQIIRLCLIDEDTGVYCGVPSFMKEAVRLVPPHSRVLIIADPQVAPYIAYQSIPYFDLEKTAADADYLFFYYPPGYIFRGGELYADSPSALQAVGSYIVSGVVNDKEYILKKAR